MVLFEWINPPIYLRGSTEDNLDLHCEHFLLDFGCIKSQLMHTLKFYTLLICSSSLSTLSVNTDDSVCSSDKSIAAFRNHFNCVKCTCFKEVK